MCLEAGLNVEGINAEVAVGQWEYQIFAKGAKEAGDQIWVSRYLASKEMQRSMDFHRMASKATRSHRLEWFGNACQLQRWQDEG